jgi:hypothetical protein
MELGVRNFVRKLKHVLWNIPRILIHKKCRTVRNFGVKSENVRESEFVLNDTHVSVQLIL